MINEHGRDEFFHTQENIPERYSNQDFRVLCSEAFKWVTQNNSVQGVFIRANVVRYFLCEGTQGEATQIGYAKSIGISKASFNRWASQFCKDFNFRAPGTFNPQAKAKLSKIHYALNKTR